MMATRVLTTCDMCIFYSDEDGTCRRYAPREISGTGTGYNEQKWAKVEKEDWCGEFSYGDGSEA